MKYLSTSEVARKVGIGRATLERWLANGKIRAPQAVQVGQGNFRCWTDADVSRVRTHKQKNYRKGRGRKKGKTVTPGRVR
jgi:excisionase family DNA binding protein